TVKEPPRGMSDGRALADTGAKPSLKQVAARLWSMKSYRFVALTVLLGAMPGYGTLGWGPTFFLRVHDLSPAVVGFWFGLTAAAALFFGSVLSGVRGDWAGRRDMRWYMRVAAFGPLACAPLGLAFLFSPSPVWAFVFIFLMQFTLALHNPPCNAMAQALAPTRIRAMA